MDPMETSDIFQSMLEDETLEAFWICGCCTEGNFKRYRYCTRCGAPRDPWTNWTCLCGRGNPADYSFCPACGAPRGSRTSWTCLCGRGNPADYSFCPVCGRSWQECRSRREEGEPDHYAEILYGPPPADLGDGEDGPRRRLGLTYRE